MAGGSFPFARQRAQPLRAFWLLFAFTFAACPPPDPVEDGGEADAGEEPMDVEPAVTAVGTPIGTAVQATLGSAGGELVSVDGRLRVTVPAGALAEDVTIELQPITHEGPGGIGEAWRLLPDVTFAVPVELTVTWTDEEILGSGPAALGLAFQTEARTWELLLNAVVDEEARTLRASVDHFTDFGFFEQFRLTPADSTLHPGDVATLQAEACFPPRAQRPASGPVLAIACSRLPLGVGQVLLSEWQVDGVIGGNATKGTVTGVGDQGRYTAPAEVPSPSTVSVSVRLTEPSQPGIGAWLVVRVHIVDDVTFIGNLTFEVASFGPAVGSGSVGWLLFEDLPDVQRYLPTGVLDVTISPDGCDPATESLLIERGTAELPVGTLVVYIGENPFADSHAFAVSTVPKDITFQCGDDAITLSTALSVGVGTCSGPFEPAPFTDPDVLEGSYDCGLTQTHAEWRFVRQPD